MFYINLSLEVGIEKRLKKKKKESVLSTLLLKDFFDLVNWIGYRYLLRSLQDANLCI